MKIKIPEEYRQNVEYYDQYGIEQDERMAVAATSFVNKVYCIMCVALFVTAGTAWWTVESLDTATIAGWMVPAMIAELVVVLLLNFLAHKLPLAVSAIAMFAYAALNGFTLSVIFFVYTKASLAGAFAVTGGIFGAMSLYGTVTKRDLTSLGSICIMALFGLILAGLVNLFLQSDAMYFVTSIIGVLVFTGLIAYDSQQIRRFGAADGGHGSLAVLAALGLYLDFINLFLYLVRLIGKRK
ncbi:MAG: Bax inhibitor-1/YccA family protein [Victivallales bacterium]|nr:Bax inhibitor-1/YccA family protein [Victivallales bacterium]